MDGQSTFTLLTLAFGLGAVHALDADHVMAVSNLISHRPGFKRTLIFCTRWAIGHGAALFVIGFAVLFLGQAIPGPLSQSAEHAVGAVLILLGLWVIVDLWRNNVHLHFHQHNGIPEHAHWHKHAKTNKQANKKDSHLHAHGATMVGVLHGTAGSAPLLALIPLSQMHSPWLGLTYLFIFAIGVLLSMLLFGGVFSAAVKWLNRFGDNVIKGFRLTIALLSITLGVGLLV
jgi:ABC-type nickel/cobalt efflux system permease component RcnA